MCGEPCRSCSSVAFDLLFLLFMNEQNDRFNDDDKRIELKKSGKLELPSLGVPQTAFRPLTLN